MTNPTTSSTSRLSEEVNDLIAAADQSTARAIGLVSLILFSAMLPVTMLVAPLKELIAVRYGAGPFWTHSFMSVNMIGAILVAPWAAVYGHRVATRKVLIAASLLADAALLAAMGYAPSLNVILGLRFFEGAAHIVAISQMMAAAASFAPRTARGRTMGLVGTTMMLGTACGTRLGGAMWNAMPGYTFQIAGGISFASAMIVILLMHDAQRDARPAGGGFVSLLRTNRRLAVPYAYAFIDRLCVGVIVSTFVLYLGNVLHLTPDARSRMLLAFLLPFSLLAYPAGRLVDRIGRVWPISLGSAAFGIVFSMYGWLDADAMLPVMVLSGVVSALMFAPSLALTADLSTEDTRGAAFTGFNVAGSLGFTIGPLLAGLVYSVVSRWEDAATAFRATFVLTGALQVLCVAVTMPALWRLRRAGHTR